MTAEPASEVQKPKNPDSKKQNTVELWWERRLAKWKKRLLKRKARRERKKAIRNERWRRFQRHATVYFLPVIGLGIVLLVGLKVVTPPTPWLEIILTISSVLIGGGILSLAMSALKIFSYFEEKLADILYGKEFLHQRKDLSELWDRITEILYHRRFPKISNKIHKLLKDSYLNSSNNYYSSYVEMKTTYKGVKDSFVICTDVVKQKIIMSDQSSQRLEMTSSVDFDDEGEHRSSYNQVKKIIVDKTTIYDSESEELKVKPIKRDLGGITLKLSRRILDNNKCKTDEIKYYLTLAGKKSYTVTRVVEKKYDLTLNTIKLFTASHIWRRMTVFVDYPDNLIMDHSELGIVNEFELVETGDLCKMHLEYNDIILPYQGIIIGMSMENSSKSPK